VNNGGRPITISLVDPGFDMGAHTVEMLDGDERPPLGFGIGAGPDLPLPNAPHVTRPFKGLDKR
jgi:hypothetical protein